MSRLDQIESLFHEALSLPPGVDPILWIQEHCQSDSDMLGEVLSLLEAHREMEREPAIAREPAPSLPTAQFGAWRAVEMLARGGMSVVYRAERTDGRYEQTVALKIMAAFLAGPEFLRRFDTERQLLAALNHNHIARLLDGGVSSAGDPFLVTEYVHGQTIDRYCDEGKLNVESRLRIFLQVCDAVDYAHRNLIVHRDLKPGNILVNEEGTVKLLDFGTASLMAAQEDVTVTRARMLTRYASPEQLRGERVNIATDVFSLGVVLYELLTGAWPFGDPGSLLSGLNRAVEDVRAKPPSTVITEESAEHRSVSRQHLGRILKGDLSPIVLKALEGEPARRYESVLAFASDIQNYLDGRPVRARPQTGLYRAGKFIRRHRIAVATCVLVTIGLATLAGYAYSQQRKALEQARRAKVVNTFLIRLFQSMNQAYGGRWDMTPADVFDRAASQAEVMLANEPAGRAQIQISLAGNLVMTRGLPASLAMAEKGLRSALESGDQGLIGEAFAHRGYLQMGAGECTAALKSAAEAESVTRQGGRISREWRIAVAINNGLTMLACGGDAKSARASLLNAVDLARQIREDSIEEDSPPRVLKAATLYNAAEALGCKDGKALRTEGFAILRGDPNLSSVEALLLGSEATCLLRSGESRAAAGLFERAVMLNDRAFGANSDTTMTARAMLAYALAGAGDTERATVEARKALAPRACLTPALCQRTRSVALIALLVAHNPAEALPVARELASSPAMELLGRTGLFVGLMQANQRRLAEPYRGAAQTMVKLEAAHSKGWHQTIEAALKQ